MGFNFLHDYKLGLHWAGAKQPVHWFLGGKGLGIQQGTSVWVGLPKSLHQGKGVVIKG